MSDRERNKKSDPIVGINQIEIDATRFNAEPNTLDLPILPTRNLILFPGITIPVNLGRESSVILATIASEKAIPIGIVCQTDPEAEEPTLTTGLYKYGVVANVLRVIDLPDGNYTAIVQAQGRFRVMGRGEGTTIPEARLSAKIKLLEDRLPENEAKLEALAMQIKSTATEVAGIMMEGNQEFGRALRGISSPIDCINFTATNMPIDIEARYNMLATSSIYDRGMMLLSALELDRQRALLNHEVVMRTRNNMEQNQRQAFLQQQMEVIREELYGDTDDEIDALAKRIEGLHATPKIKKQINKELDKLRRLNPTSPDYSVQYSYLDTVLDLPWDRSQTSDVTFEEARKILETDHYGLEKVKERILEQLAVVMNNPNGKAPILCLVGAPGVGKTSVGRSVARALGRKYERVSLGGLHDESEIRGHRRTYLGSMPGRIIDAMKRAGVSNPVLLLDEIDKIGADYKGDPSAALLEVLDPEQNCHFHDNYIDIDYDLSHVLFIATANTLQTLAAPLLDRMEVVEISGYVLDEKMEIARRHLLPRVLEEHTLTPQELTISDAALQEVIESYTNESGVRQLEKRLAKIARKAVIAKMEQKGPLPEVLPEHLYDLLGLPVHQSDRCEDNDLAGVVTGLAWTQAGGEILLAEASLSASKTPKLTITGNLGDVMKESTTIALQWVKTNAEQLGINPELFDRYDVHIHFPEGAVPKDGPSAGITIATAIVSAFTQRRVRPRTAMTGEITLRGRVLAVGGIKEKILAAKRAGVTDIILCEKNRRDVDDIPAHYREGLTFHYVDTVDQVMKLAITDEPVASPRTL